MTNIRKRIECLPLIVIHIDPQITDLLAEKRLMVILLHNVKFALPQASSLVQKITRLEHAGITYIGKNTSFMITTL
jgi:hypothetical protein